MSLVEGKNDVSWNRTNSPTLENAADAAQGDFVSATENEFPKEIRKFFELINTMNVSSHTWKNDN